MPLMNITGFYFNSNMVRLKAPLTEVVKVTVNYFNSNMVRLKGLSEKALWHPFLYFNSNMVRLKVEGHPLAITQPKTGWR